MLERRDDLLTGETVLLAPARAARPHTSTPRRATSSGSVPSCPFCPGHEGETPPEVARVGVGAPNQPGWRLRAFPNLYPFVGGVDAGPGTTGAHEVVVFSPDHGRDLARLDDDAVIEAFGVLRDRSRAHAVARRAYVQLAVNEGREAGASIEHPHAQVVALDFVPPAVVAALDRFERAGRDLVAGDCTAAGDAGLVCRRDQAASWCSPGSSAPFEVRAAALDDGPRFALASDGALRSVALALRDTLQRIAVVLGDPAYNVVVHDAPTLGDASYHWWVRVVPRVSVPAGFELGTGILVETADPVETAAALRAVGS